MLMYVCICYGVTEKDIKKAAKAGAQSLQDIKQSTGCATGCGTCADVALEVLQDAHSSRTPDFLKILKPASEWQDQATA
jgi:bacterioferritin-associated ferredoxin